MGVAQTTGAIGGDKGGVTVDGLLLHHLGLGDARGLGGLGLAVGQGDRVEVALVGSGQAPVLTGGLLPGQARADGARLEGDLGSLGRLGLAGLLGSLGGRNLGQVLGDKLIEGKVVVKCDAGKELGGVLFKHGNEQGSHGVSPADLTYEGLVHGF